MVFLKVTYKEEDLPEANEQKKEKKKEYIHFLINIDKIYLISFFH